MIRGPVVMPQGAARRSCTIVGALLLVVAAELSSPALALTQTDSVTIVPGERYGAGPIQSWLLGSDYRNLWTSPIRVPVLDLRRFAGGLTATEQGGGRQTLSLRLRGADGREYAFRSVEKWPGMATHPDVAGAFLGSLIQDQVSSMIPAAPLAAARLADAVGIIHAQPALYVMPDDPALGEFRETFGGMLGTLEERPGEQVEGGPMFGGFPEIASTPDVLDYLEDSSSHQVDARQYLYVRLVDLVIGDWDRHEDQWRWGRRDTPTGTLWIPIPRDRDYAFADYDGLLMQVVRRAVPNAVGFEDDFDDLPGLLLNAGDLDKRFLSGLERAVWDSVGTEVQARLSDQVIEGSVSRLPPEFVEKEGAALVDRVRARRDILPGAVNDFYSRLAIVPSIYSTDEDEVAVLTRQSDGRLHVAVSTAGGPARPHYSRTFVPGETREVRLYLRGGDDRALVRGSAQTGMIVRVIGGGGDDVLADSSAVGRPGRWTSLHDSGNDDQLVGSAFTILDRREFEEPEVQSIEGLIRIPDPDWGSVFHVAPSVGYSSTRGALLGVTVGLTRFAFRRLPYVARVDLGLRYATRWDDFGGRLTGRFRGQDPALGVVFATEASRIDALRFYGFGNETSDDLPGSDYVVRRELLAGEAEVRYAIGSRTSLSGGILGRYSRPWIIQDSPLDAARPIGSSGFSSVGFTSGVDFRSVASDSLGTVYRWSMKGSAFPLTSTPDNRYGALESHGAIQIPLTEAGSTRISARGGRPLRMGRLPLLRRRLPGRPGDAARLRPVEVRRRRDGVRRSGGHGAHLEVADPPQLARRRACLCRRRPGVPYG